MAEEEARKLKEINADKLKKGDVTDMDDVEMDTGGRAVKDGLRNLDLDTLAFKDGSRTMTNESCKLPDKSWRVTKPGYEEVHVPAVRNVPGEGERFVKVTPPSSPQGSSYRFFRNRASLLPVRGLVFEKADQRIKH